MVSDATPPLLGGFSPAATTAADGTRDHPLSTMTSNDQWRVFLGIALLIASYIFRAEVVRFTLRLAKRAVPGMIVWIKEFEKMLLLPVSWVVFVLLVWFSTYVMDLATLLDINSTTIASLIRLILGIPLIWAVISLCNYVIWGIIRVKGWKNSASTEDDDYNRVMIITEGIGVIKILLVAYVVSSFMFDGIGEITNFDSSQLTTVAVLVVELVALFGAHTWLKNTMGGLIALMDEQVKSGAHVRFQGHEGVVEQLFLQCVCVRRYDKGLAYIPNGLLLEHSVEIQTKAIDRRTTLQVHLDHGTNAAATRRFIQDLDGLMLKFVSERLQLRNTDVLGLTRKNRSGWDLLSAAVKAKTRINEEEEEHEQPRFWISIAAPYVVHVVYHTQERHIKDVKAEKTELVLQLTELLSKHRLRIHRAAKVAFALSEDQDGSPTRPLSPVTHSDPLVAAERPSDRFQKFASEGNVLRQRRLDRSRTQGPV